MASYKYESSVVFRDLKNIRERISGNLTTYQYLISYDDMLDNAVYPVIRDCRFFDTFILRLVGWQEKNFRRKVSFLDRKSFPHLAMNFLVSKGTEARMKAFRSMSLDRGIRVEALNTYYSLLGSYEKACDLDGYDIESALHLKKQTEDSFACTAPSLLSSVRESRYWLSVASEFKQKLLEKYVRLCLTTAQRDYTNYFDCSVKLDDLIQTYLIAASRAIDKCDYKQGVLTSHVQNWLFTARDSMAKMRDRNTDSHELINLDDVDTHSSQNHEEISIQLESVNVISELARLMDPVGAARCYLQLSEPKDQLK